MKRLLGISIVLLALALTLPAVAAAKPTTSGLTLTPEVGALKATWSLTGVAANQTVVAWALKSRPVTEPVSKWTAVKPNLAASAREYTFSGLEVRPYEVQVVPRYEETGVTGVKVGKGQKATATPLAAIPTKEGEVKYRLDAKTYADKPWGIEGQMFLKEHVDRVLGYSTFGATHYAITEIPTVCYEDPYTKYGAHNLNPTHRAEYVKETEEDMALGYDGIFNDDIEAEGSGQHEAGTNAEIQALLEAERTAIGPSAILEINTQYVDLKARLAEKNASVEAWLAVTNQVNVEGGVNPAEGSSIDTKAEFVEYLAYVDGLHAKGIHVDQADSVPGNVFEVATYLLSNDGGDFIGSHVLPSEWNSLYDTNLGPATSGRELVGSIYRRHFGTHTVYVNPPGGTTETLEGHTLNAREGLIT